MTGGHGTLSDISLNFLLDLNRDEPMEQLNQLKKDNCNDGLDEKFAGLKFWAITYSSVCASHQILKSGNSL